MSTGAKVGIGVGGCLGLLVIAIVVIVAIASLSVSGDSTSASPAPYATEEEFTPEETAPEGITEDEPAAGQGVSMTASAAGTTGSAFDDTVYTVLDIELTNNGDEDLNVSSLYFTAVLADGTERNDWGEAILADIEQFEVTSLTPGSSVAGQIAVVGEVVVTEVRYDPSFGMEEPIVAVVE
ncbi:DUF4352 domain-containing protein [Nocardiopsis quinghaiensis]|uniref:DUF4352 domain-containing protein n=1 Tax=Nocardiopsis quinghaiensis TaxID=464995 RepID=UPI001CC25A00|nr:DUF4352 domain-containing protein [Nocardiopsis quinghaiensis]